MIMLPEHLSATTLEGCRIFVACTLKTAARVHAGLRRFGASTLALPLVEIREILDNPALDEALGRLHAYAWIIFTSSYGVDLVLRRLARQGITPASLAAERICAIGPMTAARLQDAGIPPLLIPQDFSAEGILQALSAYHGSLEALAGRPILIPRAREARDLLPRKLAESGAEVDVVVAYENAPAALDERTREAVIAFAPEVAAFTSSLTFKSFLTNLGSVQARKLLDGCRLAAMGPATRTTIESRGLQVEILPRENTIPALVEAIRENCVARRGLNSGRP